jgi:acetamidase/formamidase
LGSAGRRDRWQTVTGPIYVNGAEPGDVLKVTLNKIAPRAYATSGMSVLRRTPTSQYFMWR